jgi:hypothetical protein
MGAVNDERNWAGDDPLEVQAAEPQNHNIVQKFKLYEESNLQKLHGILP